jgi:hypothetical protein
MIVIASEAKQSKDRGDCWWAAFCGTATGLVANREGSGRVGGGRQQSQGTAFDSRTILPTSRSLDCFASLAMTAGF